MIQHIVNFNFYVGHCTLRFITSISSIIITRDMHGLAMDFHARDDVELIDPGNR